MKLIILSVNFPRRFPHCPFIAEHQTGKLWIPIWKSLGLTRLGIDPEFIVPEAHALSLGCISLKGAGAIALLTSLFIKKDPMLPSEWNIPGLLWWLLKFMTTLFSKISRYSTVLSTAPSDWYASVKILTIRSKQRVNDSLNASRLQILCEGFDSQLEPNAFFLYA